MASDRSSATGHDVATSAVVQGHAFRKERVQSSKDKGAKNDEHVPEGASPIPGTSEWTENLFSEGDWRVSANAWAGFGLRVLLICGTLFTVFQYMAQRQETRVERALQLVEIWERSEYQEAQKALKDRLAALIKDNPNTFGNAPKELALYYEKIGLAAMTAAGGDMALPLFQEHFDKMLYFLNRVAFCVDRNICDQDIADSYFADFAADFWRYFHGYVEKQRKEGSANYAEAVEKYVAETAPATAAR
jgi:hypothetical protein